MKVISITAFILVIIILTGFFYNNYFRMPVTDSPDITLTSTIVYPGVMLYPLKTIIEYCEEIITVRTEAKANMYFDFMDRRLEEAYILTKQSDQQFFSSVLERYESLYTWMPLLVKKSSKLEKYVVVSTTQHLQKLNTLLGRVHTKPERRAVISAIDSLQEELWKLINGTTANLAMSDLTGICTLLQTESTSQVWNETEQLVLKMKAESCKDKADRFTL